MCNGCSTVEPSGEVPGTECLPFELKVIADILSSSQTSLCVPGAGVRTILSSSALEVLSMPRAMENRMVLTWAQGSWAPALPCSCPCRERQDHNEGVFIQSLKAGRCWSWTGNVPNVFFLGKKNSNLEGNGNLQTFHSEMEQQHQ